MLVTETEYRLITNDATSAASAVSARLEQAEDLVEEYLQRTLVEGTYTETLEVWYEDGVGVVYPMATPITAVPVDAAYAIDVGERRLRGVVADASSTGITWPTGAVYLSEATSAISPFSRARPDYATVEYTGGFTNATLPVTLKQYIAWIARALALRTSSSTIGATSLTVGDISVTYPKVGGSLDALVPGVTIGLRPYRRKRVRF